LSGCGDTTPTYSPTNTTNKEWVNGVAREGVAGFYLKNTTEATRDFAVGKKIIFADGSIRTVKGFQINGGDLIVYLDGSPLNGELVGYPKLIKPYVETK
jgi:endoglucanase